MVLYDMSPLLLMININCHPYQIDMIVHMSICGQEGTNLTVVIFGAILLTLSILGAINYSIHNRGIFKIYLAGFSYGKIHVFYLKKHKIQN